MRNSRAIRIACVAALLCMAAPAFAVDGYLAQRFDPAPAGAGWLTQDSLKLSGGLGGAVAVTTGYTRTSAANPGTAPIFSDFARANIGFAATYSRYRLSFDLASPLYVRGSGPSLDIASHPDTILDVRIGLDARIWGDVNGPFRLGAGAQLFVPSADRSDYMSDGTYRGQFRVLAAGDVGQLVYAANVGFHVRPLMGHELVYGAAAGWRLPVGEAQASVVIGAEYNAAQQVGAVAHAMTDALLTGRLELPKKNGQLLRLKIGGGLNADIAGGLGWRAVVGVEIVGLATADTPAD